MSDNQNKNRNDQDSNKGQNQKNNSNRKHDFEKDPAKDYLENEKSGKNSKF